MCTFVQLCLLLTRLPLGLVRNKAVADGAVSFYLDHFVAMRVAKFSYGARCFRIYDAKNREHAQRSLSAYVGVDGKKHIPNGFEVVLHKVYHITPFYSPFYSHSSLPEYSGIRNESVHKILFSTVERSNCSPTCLSTSLLLSRRWST